MLCQPCFYNGTAMRFYMYFSRFSDNRYFLNNVRPFLNNIGYCFYDKPYCFLAMKCGKKYMLKHIPKLPFALQIKQVLPFKYMVLCQKMSFCLFLALFVRFCRLGFAGKALWHIWHTTCDILSERRKRKRIRGSKTDNNILKIGDLNYDNVSKKKSELVTEYL